MMADACSCKATTAFQQRAFMGKLAGPLTLQNPVSKHCPLEKCEALNQRLAIHLHEGVSWLHACQADPIPPSEVNDQPFLRNRPRRDFVSGKRSCDCPDVD